MGQHAYKASPQNAKPDVQTSGHASMPVDRPVGEILRQARLYHKLSISDVERALNIRATQLEAIETNRPENLPAQVYAIGFVRSYASYLGLDSERIVSLFKSQSASVTALPDLHFPVAARQANLPSSFVLIASMMLCVVALSLWWSGHHSGSQNVIPEVSEELSVTAQATAISTQVYDSQSELPAPAREGIVITVKESSWIQIQDGAGQNVVSRVLNVGDQYFVPDRPDLKMSLGNAGGIEIEVNGKPFPTLGASGDVRRDIPLDIEKLKAMRDSEL